MLAASGVGWIRELARFEIEYSYIRTKIATLSRAKTTYFLWNLLCSDCYLGQTRYVTEPRKASALVITKLDPRADPKSFESVASLADANRATLGFLPRSALEAEALAGHMVTASQGGVIMGYALFGLARERLRLTHLCVDPGARRQGVAGSLIQYLSGAYSQTRGIGLKCRRDYGLAEFWLRLGFSPTIDVQGRSSAGHLLTVWWLDHGHADLFTQALGAEGRLTATIGLDVFAGIHGGAKPTTISNQAQALDKSRYRSQIDLVVTSELLIELDRLPEEQVRRRLKEATSTYATITVGLNAVDELAQQLWIACQTNDVEVREKAVDLRLLAAAALADVDLFISTDDLTVDRIGPAIEELINFRILRPGEAIGYVDENYSPRSYHPQQILNTGVVERRLTSMDERIALQQFASLDSMEILRSVLAVCAVDGERRVILSTAGDTLALYAFVRAEQVLSVRILRVAEGELAYTISYQLLRSLRELCVKHACHTLTISDESLASQVSSLLELDGFQRFKDGWTVPVIAEVLTWVQLKELIAYNHMDDLLRKTVPSYVEAEEISPALASRLEHVWWPLKICGSDVATYLVPIKPNYAQMLLGTRETLFTRPEVLGLSREHVYYKSDRSSFKRPARIFWYESGEVGAVTAVSQLVTVDRNAPELLHARYAHLGVWDASHVLSAAGDLNTAMALRVRDTQIFDHPINYSSIWDLIPNCRRSTLQSALEINEDGFVAIYKRGIGRYGGGGA